MELAQWHKVVVAGTFETDAAPRSAVWAEGRELSEPTSAGSGVQVSVHCA